MPTATFEYRSEAERVAMQRAIAFVAQLHDLALSAPPGKCIRGPAASVRPGVWA